MKQKKRVSIWFLVLLTGCLMAACKSGPDTKTGVDLPEAAASDRSGAEVKKAAFDLGNVSQELYDSTISDVRIFIEMLNILISRKDYEGWKSHLSEEFFKNIASPGNLKNMSEQPAMKMQKIVLRSPEDYFNYVVVPSRANSRVDEIEFLSQNMVKAYTIRTNKDGELIKLRLYELEKTGNTWKIIN